MSGDGVHGQSERHVLVADDEPHIGRIIKMKLEQGPFRVTLAYDGREAIELLDREPDVQLVLLDLMMPAMDGIEFRRHQQADMRFRDIPVVCLSARHDAQQTAIRLGILECLGKPFELDAVLAAIFRHCGV